MFGRVNIRNVLDAIGAIAMIVASVCVILVSSRPVPDGSRSIQSPTRPEPYKPGDTLDVIPRSDLAGSPMTLVMFVRDGCHFCEASMEFYRSLAAAPARHAKILVAGRESAEDLSRYVTGFGFRPDSFLSIGETHRLRIAGTPTLGACPSNRL